MAKVSLNVFACPACNDGTMVKIEVDEDSILQAKRLPAAITAACPKKHSLVVFVDGSLQVRDVEVAVSATGEDKDALDKTKDWLGSL